MLQKNRQTEFRTMSKSYEAIRLSARIALVEKAHATLSDLIGPTEGVSMCRNIKPLFNFEPKATEEEVRVAALQYVRKISGSVKPSARNEAAFNEAVEQITRISGQLLASMTTTASAKTRQEEDSKAKERGIAKRLRDGVTLSIREQALKEYEKSDGNLM